MHYSPRIFCENTYIVPLSIEERGRKQKQFDSARLGSTWLGSARLDSAWFGLARLGSGCFSATRVDSTRSGTWTWRDMERWICNKDTNRSEGKHWPKCLQRLNLLQFQWKTLLKANFPEYVKNDKIYEFSNNVSFLYKTLIKIYNLVFTNVFDYKCLNFTNLLTFTYFYRDWNNF